MTSVPVQRCFSMILIEQLAAPGQKRFSIFSVSIFKSSFTTIIPDKTRNMAGAEI